jgi:enamine deaminase RidA (YjgF/YER057c/UK114 family)
MLVSVSTQIAEQDKDAMIREGATTAKDYEEAMQEVQLMLEHPGAFAMGMTFLAVGRVV